MSLTSSKFRSSSSSSRPSISSQGNRKPLLTINQRQIIKGCMDNSKEDIGERIFRRALERRDDFKQFIDNLSKVCKQREAYDREMNFRLRDLKTPTTWSSSSTESSKTWLILMRSTGICRGFRGDKTSFITRLSEEFGCNHVQFRANGFKPDFFACTAEAVTTECTFLDQAAHPTSETASAWSLLTSHVFSAVRDGSVIQKYQNISKHPCFRYYAELRRQRKSSNAFRARVSVDVVSTGTDDGTSLSSATRRSLIITWLLLLLTNPRSFRSNSPQEEIAETFEHSETNCVETSGNFLAPPTVYWCHDATWSTLPCTLLILLSILPLLRPFSSGPFPSESPFLH